VQLAADLPPRVPPSLAPQALRLAPEWVGYFVAVGILFCELSRPAGVRFFWFMGVAYWLLCVYRMHRVLATVTSDRYPIRPLAAVGWHFLPVLLGTLVHLLVLTAALRLVAWSHTAVIVFFAAAIVLFSALFLHWLVKWPSEIARFVKRRIPDSHMAQDRGGAIILIGLLLTGFNTAAALAVLFLALSYLAGHLRRALKASPTYLTGDESEGPIQALPSFRRFAAGLRRGARGFAVLAGLGLVMGVLLFPPWVETGQESGRRSFQFILSPPAGDYRIDGSMLLVELAAFVAVAYGFSIVGGRFRRSKELLERSRY
jgi:hypothetical protein